MRIALPYEATAAMRIDDSNNGPFKTQGSSKTNGQVRNGQQPPADSSRDSVMISDLSNLLSHLETRVGSDRAAMVSRLAEQYRSGKYTVDNVALGNALISGAFEG